MSSLKRVAIVLFCLLGMTVNVYAENEVLTDSDRENLEAAIDDYRFSDFKGAVDKLIPLQAKYPADRSIAEVLGRSYEESGQTEKALSLYQQWLAAVKDDHSDEARFAWIGMANALVKLKKQSSAMSSLKQWVAYHPDDAVASTMYGGLLFQANDYAASEKIWDGILKQSQAPASDKSAAHYYKAVLAYMNGDMESQKQHAQASLDADAKGPYAASATQLLTARPARKLGLNAMVAIEEYLTSNVELLPDFKAPTPGKKKSDTSTSATLSLSYNFPEALTIGYIFSGDFHAKRNDLDLAYHSLFALWTHSKGWFVSPKYEYAQLGRVYLFQGGGFDAGWSGDGYQLSYGLRYKVFNKSFNTTDLRRLGGVSNRLDMSKTISLADLGLSLTGKLSAINESTKGDAAFAKSDSFNQFGGGASVMWGVGQYLLGADLDAYYKKYNQAVPTSALPVRSDNHWQLSGNAGWKPTLPIDLTLMLKAGVQRNNSNDSTKGYSEWRTGLAVNFVW